MKKRLSFLIALSVASCVAVNAGSGCALSGNACCDAGVDSRAVADSQDGLPVLSPDEVSRVHEFASKVDSALKAKFEKLHDEWYRAAAESPEISMSSSVGSRSSLPQFAAIVEMGKAVLPLVVEQMLEPDRFFSLSLYEALCDEKPSDEAWCQKCALQYVKSWLAATAE
ncbi:hypothetical protein [Duncaniella muris]|uniref:hypothetical protein n=1 Tax=Duncaniella muris TaxID=2094150 RepID=UPI001C3CFC3D|nr:hypothetical protein [Duncaniella muris]